MPELTFRHFFTCPLIRGLANQSATLERATDEYLQRKAELESA